MAKFNPFQFAQQTRAEISKITWPSRREVLVTTAMVLTLALIATLFFFGVDAIIRFFVRTILDLFV